ncbi:MAG: hypothetical protein LBH92_01430 [Bacteroidales bacterium]|jgi:hypothetical protein|nr:hypothetical protein [Bacteroidales bacterium]
MKKIALLILLAGCRTIKSYRYEFVSFDVEEDWPYSGTWIIGDKCEAEKCEKEIASGSNRCGENEEVDGEVFYGANKCYCVQSKPFIGKFTETPSYETENRCAPIALVLAAKRRQPTRISG